MAAPSAEFHPSAVALRDFLDQLGEHLLDGILHNLFECVSVGVRHGEPFISLEALPIHSDLSWCNIGVHEHVPELLFAHVQLLWCHLSRLVHPRSPIQEYCKIYTKSAWALHLRCASVDGSEQAITCTSSSHLCEPTLCAQSCLLLDSDISVELGKAEISGNAESFGNPQAVTDDHETHRDCLIDGQCKPPSSDRPDTLALHYNPPSHSDTDHNLL